MSLFKVAHAVAQDWAHAAQACADGLRGAGADANVGFVYATDKLAEELPSIIAYLRQNTGIDLWVGTVGIGICADDCEYFDQPALAVMAARFRDDGFRVFRAINRSIEQLAAEDRAWITDVAPPFGIVHGDPHNPRTLQLIDELAAETGFLVGGLTSSRQACHQVAGRITGGGLSGILFAPDVAVQTGLSQGCTPIGPSHLISDCVDNVVIGLDGRRALDVFQEDVGELLAKDLRRAAGFIHPALPLPGCDTGDYMVRNLAGIDTARGWLAIGQKVKPGERILFVRRDPASARSDLEGMLDRLMGRLTAPPRGGVYFSCVARGPGMFGAAGEEMAIVKAKLGEVPVIGFFGNGEISGGRLYGYTGVLALFV